MSWIFQHAPFTRPSNNKQRMVTTPRLGTTYAEIEPSLSMETLMRCDVQDLREMHLFAMHEDEESAIFHNRWEEWMPTGDRSSWCAPIPPSPEIV